MAELRELFVEGAKQEGRRQAKKAGVEIVKSGVKRAKSAWQRYMAKKSNQIKFKSGPKKGRLDLSKMSRAYKRSQKGKK